MGRSQSRTLASILAAALVACSGGTPDQAALAETEGSGVVVEVFTGEEHCGWQSIDIVRVTGPDAPVHTAGDGWVDFVRDREGLLPEHVVFDTLDLHAHLPDGAADTGLRTPDGAQLWLDPDEPSAGYFVADGRVERWPVGYPGCD